MNESAIRYTIKMNLEEITLPPFEDILILGRNGTQGKTGLFQSLQMLYPGAYEMVDIQEQQVEAIYISRKIIRKISVEKVVAILRKKVFGLISEGELAKLDFKISISFTNMDGE
ncbi:hypothetical protein [Deminuibacter soli]|uniref:Uncharacterized protein n=1 Tax=Deminuibacter soli TaxID=2291815 RepID=A0A3E1NLN2_9BACT|nr:hypothetical protein [Deminuibacter soli]RFM28801.1 hypothetical protein DXN05_08485 [Deminuibacter soli]